VPVFKTGNFLLNVIIKRAKIKGENKEGFLYRLKEGIKNPEK